MATVTNRLRQPVSIDPQCGRTINLGPLESFDGVTPDEAVSADMQAKVDAGYVHVVDSQPAPAKPK